MDKYPRARRERRIVAATLVPAALCAALALFPPALLTRLDLEVYDTLLRFAHREPPDPRVAVVDVDDRSLATVGQWPWRRDVIGQLIARLRDLGARVVALDIVFSEPDRSSPFTPGEPRDAARAAGPADADSVFAEALRSGDVVLGYAFTFGGVSNDSGPGNIGSQPPAPRCVLHPLGVAVVQTEANAGDVPMFHAADAICSLPVLAEAAGASGFLNAAPDVDGILRRVPLVIEFGGHTYPSLALAAVTALASGRPALELRSINANTTTLDGGDADVPLDGRSNLLLRYRGRNRTFPYTSAADVLSGRAPADAFKGQVVFVGATALGAQELMATPYDRLFTGVEVQATAADNLLQGDFIRRPEHAGILQVLLVFFVSLAVGVLLKRAGGIRGGAACVGCLVTVWAGTAWLLDAHGIYLSPVLPTLSLFTTLMCVTAVIVNDDARSARAGLERARDETAATAHIKEEFLMTVSHELRTPLTAIYGYAQMLARGVLKEDQKARALATIERNLRAQTQLIDDLLDASQAVGGKLRLAMTGVDVADVIRSVVDGVRPAIDAKGLDFQMSLDDKVGAIPGDPDRLTQIVWNLLSNAVKFTPDRGRVDVRLERAGACAQLTVSDTGAGIEPGFLPHVFERFRQEEIGTTKQFGGVGLGLALVRYLVELHGGTVEAHSDGQGRGALFCVRLPLTAQAPPSRSAGQRIGAERLDGFRVLVVDDYAASRKFLATSLSAAGAVVATAASAQDALALLRDAGQDALVLSLELQRDDPYQLARDALGVTMARGEHLSIVALGGSARASRRTRAIESGIARHLPKPVDALQLLAAVAAGLRRDAGRDAGV